MKIFLDTANLAAIKMYNDMGLVDGITTNPSLLAKEGGDPQKTMEEIVRIVKGDVSLEVLSIETSGMLEEGRRLRKYGNNVVVKCPLTPEGLKACKMLTVEGIPVNITLCFSVNQAILAAKAGAKYVSPFIGRLDDNGQDGINLITNLLHSFLSQVFDIQCM